MVPERRVKADTRVQQRPEWRLKLLDEVLEILTSVQVVPEHDHQLERKPAVIRRHLSTDGVLRLLACAVVTDRSKLQ